MSMYPLTGLRVGESARVCCLQADGAVRRRLQDIGLIEGTTVQCVLQRPGGTPKAYRIRGAVIALRSEDSSRILMEG